jgi:hypothetical protein
VLKRAHGGAGGRDQFPVQLCFLRFAPAVLDGEGALLGQPAVIAPDDRRRARQGARLLQLY